jgi:MYXO-CTERM domain-containing protein
MVQKQSDIPNCFQIDNIMRTALVLTAGLLTTCLAQAEVVSFTNSSMLGLTAATGTAAGANLCSSKGVCSTAIQYQTGAGGVLTVTAADSPDVDSLALVNQSNYSNAGLGVVTGYESSLLHKFVIVDGDYSLSAPKETLTLSFSSQVSLSQLFFFPNDRSSYALNHELDAFDGFTLSVDGGAFKEYSFGTHGGHPVSFNTPLVGNTFTFGYAKHMSIENYYLAALQVSPTSAVPEAGTSALMALGLLGVGIAASARRRHDQA